MSDGVEIAGFARALILACGAELQKRRQAAAFEVRQKDGHADVVTDDDVWAQDYLATRIRAKYPDHAILSEEGLFVEGESEWMWVIDPIDGTTNYCRLGKCYAISLGIRRAGAPAHGLVLDVFENRLHEAAFSRPAPDDAHETMEQSLLHISDRTMRYLLSEGVDPLALCARFQGVRHLGCASLELCEVAEARGGVYMSRLKAWDYAAAECVLADCGMRMWRAPLPGGEFVLACRTEDMFETLRRMLPAPLRMLFRENGGNVSAEN